MPKRTLLSYFYDPVFRCQQVIIDALRLRPAAAGSRELQEIREFARCRSDISDHLETMFAEGLSAQPRLIVELGVRGGVSTYVLERVARLCGNVPLVSVDLEDCSGASRYSNWHFVKTDDITFAGAFPQWCRERRLPSELDFLFLDTSHLLEHTVQEIRHWFPLLSERAKVCFHDTNQRRLYFRKDGSVGIGWSNGRGVIGALEQYFSASFREQADFIDARNGWLIQHTAACNGFTVLTRLGQVPNHS